MSTHGNKFTKIIEEEAKHADEGSGQPRASASPNKTPTLLVIQQMGTERVVIVTIMA